MDIPRRRSSWSTCWTGKTRLLQTIRNQPAVFHVVLFRETLRVGSLEIWWTLGCLKTSLLCNNGNYIFNLLNFIHQSASESTNIRKFVAYSYRCTNVDKYNFCIHPKKPGHPFYGDKKYGILQYCLGLPIEVGYLHTYTWTIQVVVSNDCGRPFKNRLNHLSDEPPRKPWETQFTDFETMFNQLLSN